MKTSTKVTIGLSVAAAAECGNSCSCFWQSDRKIHHLSNRTKVKNSCMTNLMGMKSY